MDDFHQIRRITRNDAQYPELLNSITDPPDQLYMKGVIKGDFFLSIVGTRRCSHYGRANTQAFIEAIKSLPLTIVSGMAYGIDTVAHEQAMQSGLKTIAVLGCGHNTLSYSQKKIEHKILETGGAVMSEYPPDMPGARRHFPERNRIVAGLSQATIAIEAPFKSGALITARLALEYNRDVYALPGDIDRKQSRGCNALIQRSGATPLLQPEDILQSFTFQHPLFHQPLEPDLPEEQKLIFNHLTPKKVLSFEQLLELAQLPEEELFHTLSLLELEGYIKKEPGGYRKTV